VTGKSSLHIALQQRLVVALPSFDLFFKREARIGPYRRREGADDALDRLDELLLGCSQASQARPEAASEGGIRGGAELGVEGGKFLVYGIQFVKVPL
jgi:hypothetical protein